MFNTKLFFKNNKLFPAIFNVYVERYSFLHLCNDIYAGTKIFVLLFPVLISLAVLCGESPIAGLISGIAAMGTSIIFGNTKYQVSSISFPLCTLVTEIMIKYQYKGLLITSFCVCIILYVFSRLKIGNVLQYTANTFLSAIYVYVSIFIILSQLQYMLGINTTLIFNNILLYIIRIQENIWNVQLLDFYYAVSFLGLLVLLRFVFNGYISLIIYIILCSIVMLCSEFNLLPFLKYIDIKTISIELFNYLDHNNIFLISYKLPTEAVLGNLITVAFAISLVIASQVSFCVGIGASITFDKNLKISRELFSIGIANFLSLSAGGLFISPDNELSIQNIQFKSKSVISILTTVLLLSIVYIFKDYIFMYIPVYSISSVLIVISISVIRNANIGKYILSQNKEKYIFWTTLSIALYFGFIPAVFIGFVLSLFSFAIRMVNLKDPSVYTNRDHDRYINEFISNKYGYLNTQKIPKELFNKIEVIQIKNVLTINLLEIIMRVLISSSTFPKFIIVYFQNTPFLDGEALLMLKEFVNEVKKSGSTVILCGTNGVLLELLQNKEKESNTSNVFGYIIPNFQDALSKILKVINSTKTK